MPDLEPITREEMLLDGEDLTPITRKEKFIKRIYDKTQSIPEPITREEYFLKKAGEGGGGDIDLQTLTVTENGETDAPSGVAYNKVITNVPQPTLSKLTVTENGTQTAAQGTAWNEVEVDVPLPENAYLLKEVENLPQPIASFSDGADAPLNALKVNVDLVQSGSGDPSPENVRPFVGYTEAVIKRTAVNQFGGDEFKVAVKTALPSATINETAKTISFLASASVSKYIISRLRAYDFNYYPFKDNTQYTIILTGYNANYSDSNLQIVYTDGTTDNLTFSGSGSYKKTIVYNSRANKTISRLVKRNAGGSTVLYYDECGLFEGVITAEEFVAYNGNTYYISFGQTVYGSDDFSITDGYVKPYKHYASYNGETLVGEWRSDRDVYAEGTTPTTGAEVVDLGAYDITIQLSPTMIRSLANQNNIFSDTGDVTECEYFSKGA